MKKFLYFCLVASIALYGLLCVNAMHEEEVVENSSESEEYVTHATDLSDLCEQNLNNSRTARMLIYPRGPSFTIRRRKPVNIRSRADHYPILTQLRRVKNSAQPLRYGYDSLKSSKYNLASKGSYGDSAKGTSLRHQLLSHVHPNGVHVPALSQQYVQNFKASPSYNGKVIVHPVAANQQSSQQQQQQQQQQKPGQQDTNYPKYIKPPPSQQQQQQQQQTHHHQQQQLGQQQQQQQSPSVGDQLQYPDFKQFPIPDEQKMQKYNEQHEKYLQQQKYLSNRDPVGAFYQQQYAQAAQQQQQQVPQLQPFQYPYTPQQNYNAVVQQQQQPSYIAPKPVVPHIHPPAIPIHQITSDALQSHHGQLSSTATPPHKMYSVYEENDMTELQNNNYQTAAYESLEKEAQEYLKFMNTNEYFLPKRDPNYRLQDEENDRRQQYNQRLQSNQKTSTQTPVPYIAQSQYYQQAAQQQQQQLNDYNYQNTYSQQQQQPQQQQPLQLFSPNLDSSSSASSYQQPIKGPQLFYPDDASVSTSQHGQPSTVVKTSYQTGYNANQIVVSSQDQYKTSKYIGNGQNSIVVSTQSPVVSVNNIYSQVRQSPSQQKGRTPEPLRFEFTERDAMVGGLPYTFAPTTGHLRYKAVEPAVTPKLPTTYSTTPSTTLPVLSTTLRTSNYHSSGGVGVKPVLEVDDDPEDEDDMQHAGSNLYGRQPLLANNHSNNKSTHLGSTTESPAATSPSDQKDTEEYCERICAIVEDEHEEIVCGSDGYMYTSEAQMECYASCLHIDVTIQGKGSCSAR